MVRKEYVRRIGDSLTEKERRVLLYAASGNSAINGCRATVLFGLGTTISPLIFIGGAMGWLSAGISRKIPQHSGLFQRICGLVLVSFGIKLILKAYV